jgi:hypothetical protein
MLSLSREVSFSAPSDSPFSAASDARIVEQVVQRGVRLRANLQRAFSLEG